MNEPLALVFCARGLIASQLTHRLEGLRYRWLIISAPIELREVAEVQRPMVVLADLDGLSPAVISAVQQLRANRLTAHIPVIAFARAIDDAIQSDFAAFGVSIVVNESAILGHLPQLLDRALDLS